MTLALRYAAMSHVGLLRSGNEDSVYAGPRLLAVADGMGGHAAGEVASAVAIASLAALDEDAPGADLLAALKTAAVRANDSLRDMVRGDGNLDGMGTTLTTLLFTGNRLGLLHIGDSRCYLLRDGALSQITHDDTLVQSLVDEGRISEEEAGSHPQRSLITRALDGRDDVDFDTSVREARVGDRYLLCTDGLTGPVASRDTLLEALLLPDPQAAVERLVDLALRGGGPDNITVIVADVVDGESTGLPVVAGAAAESPQPAPAHLTGGAAGRAAAAKPTAPAPPARPRPAAEPARTGGRSSAVLALGVAALLLLAGGGGWAYVRSQWFVGADAAQVTVFRGVTGSVAGLDLSSVERRTDLPVGALSELDRVGVERGIAAKDADDAQRIVQELQERARTGAAAPAPAPPAPVTPVPVSSGPSPAPSPADPGPVVTAPVDDAPAVPAPPTRRGTELALLVYALLLSLLGYIAVGLAVDGRVPSGVLGYGAGLGGLFLLAHLVVRAVAPYADPLIVPCVALLNGLGLVMVRRLDFAEAEAAQLGSRVAPRADAPLQLMWTAVGIVLLVAVLLLVRDHTRLARYTYTCGAVGIGLLLLPVLPVLGREINGARLWVRLGPVQVQPSEAAKLALMIFFAGYLVSKRDVLSLASRRVAGLDLPRARDLGPVLLAWLASLGVLVLEKDLGSSLLFFGIFIVMLYVATERTSWLVIGLLLFAGGAFTAWTIFGHVQQRVAIWLHPFDDAQGDGYQLVQSLFGFGTGGLTGTGLGQGSPEHRPVRQDRLHPRGHRRGARADRRHGRAAAVRARRRARDARRAGLPRLVRQAARRGAVVRARPAGVRHRRRRDRPHPAHRRHAALAVVRRLQRRRQLGPRRAAAADQRRGPPARPGRRRPRRRPGRAVRRPHHRPAQRGRGRERPRAPGRRRLPRPVRAAARQRQLPPGRQGRRLPRRRPQLPRPRPGVRARARLDRAGRPRTAR